jgi:hypothetical protein
MSFAIGCVQQDSPFVSVGQYRDSSNDRIFAVTFRPNTTEETMRAFGMHATNTSGRMTAVYFFAEGSQNPGAALKTATSLEQATAAIAGSKGQTYVYQRATNGKEAFVNCSSSPTHELCQKQ